MPPRAARPSPDRAPAQGFPSELEPVNKSREVTAPIQVAPASVARVVQSLADAVAVLRDAEPGELQTETEARIMDISGLIAELRAAAARGPVDATWLTPRTRRAHEDLAHLAALASSHR